MKPVQIGAGVRIHADCQWGHKNIWESCEFTNKTRTSVIDIMIGVYQLVIGLNMSQVLYSTMHPLVSPSPTHAIPQTLFIEIERTYEYVVSSISRLQEVN